MVLSQSFLHQHVFNTHSPKNKAEGGEGQIDHHSTMEYAYKDCEAYLDLAFEQ
jgi:hypothetical protein